MLYVEGLLRKLKRPISIGDIVLVTETESPWINGTWRGEVMWIGTETTPMRGSYRIKPIDKVTYRTAYQPRPEYLDQGLFITSHDKVCRWTV